MLRKLITASTATESPGTSSAPQLRISTPSGKTTVSPDTASVSKKQSTAAMSSATTPHPSLGQVGKAPSLLGLLASKRFAKRLGNRYGRTNSMYGSSRYSNTNSNNIPIKKEPTYRMEPKNKFNSDKVEEVLARVMGKHLSDYKYHPKFCSNMCKIVSDDIKDAVKRLRYDRYKLIVVVHIGEKRDQSTIVSSRCAWDEKLDDFASYSLETSSLFATASVYGVYTE